MPVSQALVSFIVPMDTLQDFQMFFHQQVLKLNTMLSLGNQNRLVIHKDHLPLHLPPLGRSKCILKAHFPMHLTDQRTFSGVAHEIEFYCLSWLVIRFQISNNIELISRNRKRILNLLCCMCHLSETENRVNLFWCTPTSFTTIFLISQYSFSFFFSDDRGNTYSLLEI